MWETGWTDKGDKEGFLAVFPEGTRPEPSKPARFVGNPQRGMTAPNEISVPLCGMRLMLSLFAE